MAEIEGTKWDDPHDIKRRYPKASVLGNQQVIFDICGSKYRLWVSITYKSGMVLVRNIGTHDEYDKWKIDK
jgi:mRNA interferase HigB